MFEELQLALMDVVMPERLFVILDAQRLLNELGLTTADEELQTIIGLQDGISDTDLLVGRVDDCLTIALRSALREYGVTPGDDVRMPVLTALLRTVGQFEFYLVPTLLAERMEAALSNEELLASVVPLFTEVSENEAFEALTQVEDATITRMRTVTRELLTHHPTTPREVNQRDLRTHRINQILVHTQRFHPVHALELSQAGVGMGLPLEHLVDLTVERLEALDLEPLAYELIGLGYYSNTPVDTLLVTLQELTRSLTDDLQQQHQLKTLLHQVYHQYADLAEVTQ